MKIRLIPFLILLASSITFGQVYMNDMGNGNHQFESAYPDSDLHFYLFGDGYHSFESNPAHQYHSDNDNNGPVVYHTTPYDDDDPDLNVLGSITTTTNGTVDLAPAEMEERQIQIKRSWNLVQESENFFIVMFQNNSSFDPIDGCIEFHYNYEHSLVNDNGILDDYNDWVQNKTDGTSEYTNEGFTHKLSWGFSELQYGEQRYIYVPVKCQMQPFAHVNVASVIYYEDCNNEGKTLLDSDQAYVLTSTVSNFPHDPNLLTSTCKLLNRDIDVNTVEYRIYFQNEGDDAAENVTIDFHTYGKYKNVILLDAKHNCSMEWLRYNSYQNHNQQPFVSQFYFEDIYLPGTGENLPPEEYDNTIGWVDFLVCYDEVLDERECIPSEIEIEFDNQPPVYANYEICENKYDFDNTCNLINCPNRGKRFQHTNNNESFEGRSQTQEVTTDLSFNLFPNPANDNISISTNFVEVNYTISIVNIHGQNIMVKEGNSKYQSIDISELESGMYYIKLNNSEETKVKAFVKL